MIKINKKLIDDKKGNISSNIPHTLIAIALVLIVAIFSFHYSEIENYITGKVTTQVYIYETPPKNCTTTLYEGLNMVSFFCETGSETINTSMRDADNNSLEYYAIYTYNPESPNNSWHTYNPYLPSYVVQGISTLNRKNGYWIKMNNTGTYFKQGYIFDSTSINIEQGWNLVGYPNDDSQNISLALQSLSYSLVESNQRDNISGTAYWYIHTPPSSGNLTTIDPMKGYWINANSDQIWTINT